ncbi:BnaC09g12440D [Brassica napus]|uniref:BnaC09g12440D protein n=1 Tax=Brassica napus TaxID=3708 RepID=A0A078F5H3_BRANA|nr:BnaC09g12440D [Brassica napus]
MGHGHPQLTGDDETNRASSSRSQNKDMHSEKRKKNTKTGPAVAVEAHSADRRTLFAVVIKLERRKSVFSLK